MPNNSLSERDICTKYITPVLLKEFAGRILKR